MVTACSAPSASRPLSARKDARAGDHSAALHPLGALDEELPRLLELVGVAVGARRARREQRREQDQGGDEEEEASSDHGFLIQKEVDAEHAPRQRGRRRRRRGRRVPRRDRAGALRESPRAPSREDGGHGGLPILTAAIEAEGAA